MLRLQMQVHMFISNFISLHEQNEMCENDGFNKLREMT